MDHRLGQEYGGAFPTAPNGLEPARQRTQQETNLLGLINPTLALSLQNKQVDIASSAKTPPNHQLNPDEEQQQEGPEDEPDDEDVEIATDSEEGELDIPKPQPKALTAKQKKKQERKTKVLTRKRGPVLCTISPSDVQPYESHNDSKVTWDDDPELVCSYNWSSVVDNSNTIFVPGGPSKWTPPTVPYNVPGDQGFHPTDYNYVRQPNWPFSAVFHAMSAMNPDYAFNDVDILADRNNLRVLLEFVQGKTVGPFRLDLYMVFNTLVIVRREDGFWRRSDGTGYGFNFEKHFTTPTPDMTDATSHYRAIRYRMGPLNVVCRFEADAYIDTAASTLSASEASAVIPPTTPPPILSDLLQRPQFSFNAPFNVLQKGHLVPGSQILELKTQVHKTGDDHQSFGSWHDQLWFGRTKHLYTGRYEAGTGKILFIKQEDATQRVKRWEDKNQLDLRKLVALLSMLKGLLMRQSGPIRSAILVREDPRGPAAVHEMLDKRSPMSRQALERHWMNHARRPRANGGSAGRGGMGPQATRGRGGAQGVGGRGGGQAHYGLRGGHAHRGQQGLQRGQSSQPRGPLGQQASNGPAGAGPALQPHTGALKTESRGGARHRGRGNASKRGRGGAEQGGG
ncbi:hypothetical protein E8E13_005676 [Curvularia kusanoi]|uniref:Geranylgeranyl pyrophosphate synthetase n=1 Tax=Curvularia kusanoi TaxID=90978 RepID=A0A9P4WCC2_CURKU|nr:hypothetical protein E8E13_005676 [Curvularia kusanoi]